MKKKLNNNHHHHKNPSYFVFLDTSNDFQVGLLIQRHHKLHKGS